MKRVLAGIITGALVITAGVVTLMGVNSIQIGSDRQSPADVSVLAAEIPNASLAEQVEQPTLATDAIEVLSTTLPTSTTTLPTQPVTLLFTGDVLIHPALAKEAKAYGDGEYNFGPMFTEVAPIIQAADLAICHLETPLDPESGTPRGFPRFSTPAEIATALHEAGFDGCSTASNHVLDRGVAGVAETIGVLDAAGLAHTGSAATPDNRGGVLYTLGQVVIGHLSYSYAVSGWLRTDEQWVANGFDAEQILADAADLDDRGADFIFVSMHWGIEFQYTPTRQQVELGAELAESPLIDLIVGHHAHRLQQVEIVNEKYVFYGLGNFLSNQEPSCCGEVAQEGAMMLVRVAESEGEWSADGVQYVPTFVDRHDGYVILPTLEPEVEEHRWSSWLIRSAIRVGTSLKLDDAGLTLSEACDWMGTDCEIDAR